MKPIVETDTLGYYRQFAVCNCYDISNIPVNRFISGVSDIHNTHNPLEDAKRFYLLNHGIGLLHVKFGDSTPLEHHQSFVDVYYRNLTAEAVRMAYYLFLICVREMRHMINNETTSDWAAAYFDEFSKDLHGAWSSCVNGGSNTMHLVQKGFWANVPLGPFTQALGKAYRCKGGFPGSYGGPKWAVIAETLSKFVFGEISGEVMYDTAFALQHNTSNIFNKPFLYDSVSDGDMIKLLDHQRAGQIPQWFYTKGQPYVSQELVDLMETYPILQGPEFKQSVDHAALSNSKPVGQLAKPVVYMTTKKVPWNHVSNVPVSEVHLMPNVEIQTQ